MSGFTHVDLKGIETPPLSFSSQASSMWALSPEEAGPLVKEPRMSETTISTEVPSLYSMPCPWKYLETEEKESSMVTWVLVLSGQVSTPLQGPLGGQGAMAARACGECSSL